MLNKDHDEASDMRFDGCRALTEKFDWRPAALTRLENPSLWLARRRSFSILELGVVIKISSVPYSIPRRIVGAPDGLPVATYRLWSIADGATLVWRQKMVCYKVALMAGGTGS
jgi:hypothetical protein